MHTIQEFPGSSIDPNSLLKDGQSTIKHREHEGLIASSGGKHPNLSLQIPPRTVNFDREHGKQGLPISSKDNSSSRGFLRGLSFKGKTNAADSERSSLLKSGLQEVSGSPRLSNVLPKFSWQRCASLPVSHALEQSPSAYAPASARTVGEQLKSHKGAVHSNVSRSLSVPSRNTVIVRSLSSTSCKDHIQSHSEDQIVPISSEQDDDEEISEEDAICRICLDVCDEGNTFKMECSCKGALRLVHEKCLVTWFSTKTNRNCDVCGQEVSNFPVSLLRVPTSTQRNTGQDQTRQSVNSRRFSIWQDFVVLVFISTICYFFFLEQLLIQDMRSRAIVIAAPFSFTLGLLASVLAVSLAIREYIWTFAALEFALTAIVVRVFYTALHLSAVYAIIYSAFIGFAIVMGLNSLYIHVYNWRVQVAGSSNVV